MKLILFFSAVLFSAVFLTSGPGHCAWEAEGISGEIFGMEDRRYHAFITLEEEYSDNIFNVDKNREDDFITFISPGVLLTLSGSKEIFSEIHSSTTAPGGFKLSRIYHRSPGRYQAGFRYNPELEFHSEHSDQDTLNHTLQAIMSYHFRGGLSLGLSDQFISNYDQMATGISSRQDKYKTNLISADISYDVTSKLSLKTEFSNNNVDYKARENSARDRKDNRIAGGVFFRVKHKTSLFVEYEHLDVNYSEEADNDSTQSIIWGGVQWVKTAKSRGLLKAGYGEKDFSGSGTSDSKIVHGQVQVNHSLTPKTSIELTGYRREDESVIPSADYTLTYNIEAGYTQKLLERLSFKASVAYKNDRFKSGAGGSTDLREDDYYNFTPSFDYSFRPWLRAGVYYNYTERDSDSSGSDYSTNSVKIVISGSI